MDEQGTDPHPPVLSRRDCLKYASVGTLLSLAGCLATASSPKSIHDLPLAPRPFTGRVSRDLRPDGVDISIQFPHYGCVSGSFVTVARAIPSGSIESVANITPVSCREDVEERILTSLGFEEDDPLPSYILDGSLTYPPVAESTADKVAYFVYYVPTVGDTVQFGKAQYVWETPTFTPGDPVPQQETERHHEFSWYSSSNRFIVSERDGQYLVEYDWQDRSRELHVEFAVSKGYYESVTHPDRPQYWPTYYENATTDPFAGAVGRAIVKQNPVLETEEHRFLAVVRFVQSLKYIRDDQAYDRLEHLKLVIETLVDGTGDCEDTSFLLIGILSQEPFNYNTALFFPPGHAAVGVDAEDIPFSCTRECVSAVVDGTRYVFVESTTTTPIGRSSFGDAGDFVAIYDGNRWHRMNPGNYVRGMFDELDTVMNGEDAD